MPCHQIRTLSVEFQMKNQYLLREAIAELGWMVREMGNKVSLRGGGIILDLDKQEAQVQDGWQDSLNELKRAYSSAALGKVAKLNLWQRKSKTGNVGILRKF